MVGLVIVVPLAPVVLAPAVLVTLGMPVSDRPVVSAPPRDLLESAVLRSFVTERPEV